VTGDAGYSVKKCRIGIRGGRAKFKRMTSNSGFENDEGSKGEEWLKPETSTLNVGRDAFF